MTIQFTHSTSRHWGHPDEDCTMLCRADATFARGEDGSAGVNTGWDVGQVEILSFEGASPIMGMDLMSELQDAAAEAAGQAVA